MINWLDVLNEKGIENPRIVQIGAHDGIVGEEYGLRELLDERECSVVMVEPIPLFFNELLKNYVGFKSKIEFENSAIYTENTTIKMLERGAASIITNSGNVDVKAITFETLLEKYNIKEIDILLLDCEGYESEILKNIDFSKIHVDIIRYEYKWVSDNASVLEHLTKYGYKYDYCSHDTEYNIVCYK